MAYIGVQPTAGQYRKLDNISASFNGSSTSFTTSVGGTNVTAGTAQQLIVSLGGVIQQPDTDYTVSTSTITFTTAPAAGLDFFAILMGDALNTVTPSDGSVTTAKLAGSLSVGLAAGTVSAPSLFFTGDSNNGIYSPGADQLAVTTNGTQRLIVDSTGQIEAKSLGTAAAPVWTFVDDPNTGFWSPTADTLAASTNGSERLRVTSTGLVGIGTSSPGAPLHIVSNSSAEGIRLAGRSSDNISSFYFRNNADSSSYGLIQGRSTDFRFTSESGSQPITFHTDQERVRITGAGNVGIGTTSPNVLIHASAAEAELKLVSTSGSNSALLSFIPATQTLPLYIYANSSRNLIFQDYATERMRIDSSGRLLVGTSSAPSAGAITQYAKLVTYGNTGGSGFAGIINIGRGEGASTITSGEEIGYLTFSDNIGNEFATIACVADANAGTNDYPGRLSFSTTADGASSPGERMRITSTGAVLVNTTSTATNAVFEVSSNGTKKSLQVYNNDNVQLYSLGTGTVYSNGGVLTNTNPSDERLKDNIETLDWGLEQVMALRPVSFDWKNNRTNQGKQYGFIAQEVQSVMPELVNEFETVDGDETVTRLGLEKDGIYAAMVKALQEQQAMITELQAKVAALESA